MPNAPEPAIVLPRHQWPAALKQSACRVFSIMTREDIVAIPEPPATEVQATGIVGIAGAVRANVIVKCNAATAALLASRMLGTLPDDPGAEEASSDALGEICNVLAGDFKARIGHGFSCMLSIPTVIRGGNYQFRSSFFFERIELCFEFAGQVISATLEIAKPTQKADLEESESPHDSSREERNEAHVARRG